MWQVAHKLLVPTDPDLLVVRMWCELQGNIIRPLKKMVLQWTIDL